MSTMKHAAQSVRELIRAGVVSHAERQVTLLLREGLESGEGIPVNRAYWQGKRRRAARSRR